MKVLRFIKKIVPLFIAVAVLTSGMSAFALSLSCRGGFVLDSQTYEALYEYNADTPMVPASMTKILSLYVIYSHLADGSLTKETQIPVGRELAAYSRDPMYSNVALTAGATYSVDELLAAICVVSANAAVMAIGDYICGSEAGFVNEMNNWLSYWGVNGWFVDCTGVSSRNKISPRGMGDGREQTGDRLSRRA